MKIIKIPIIFCCVLLSGCFSAVPPNNSPFISVNRLSQLNGIYMNKGEGALIDAPNARVVYLSDLLWKEDATIQSQNIDKIEIQSIRNEKLIVKAKINNIILKESVFVPGKDFSLKSGRIPLQSRWGIPLPIFGVGWKDSSIGLDAKSNIKYQEIMTAVGFFALIIPIIINGNEEFRFKKIPKDSELLTHP